MHDTPQRTALITGAHSVLSQKLAALLQAQNMRTIGLDVRSAPSTSYNTDAFDLLIHVNRYDHRHVADIFRTHAPHTLLHLGIRSTSARTLHQRFTQNVLGTRSLLQQALKNNVQSAVILSTYHVYGAHQYNPVLIDEDAPLRAAQLFPELIDAIELDHTSTNFLWRQRDHIHTTVLRFANIIGPTLRNRISRLLSMPLVPRLLGYNPMMQFIHEDDAAKALARTALQPQTGVFNVAGEGAIPYERAIHQAGGRSLPLPFTLAKTAISALEPTRLVFPAHLIDYFRYATIIDDTPFRTHFGYSPTHNTLDTLRSLQTPSR